MNNTDSRTVARSRKLASKKLGDDWGKARPIQKIVGGDIEDVVRQTLSIQKTDAKWLVIRMNALRQAQDERRL